MIPFLRSQGIKQVDVLIVSHGDNDHSGGVTGLLKTITVKKLLTSVPHRFHRADACQTGQHWQWDGVQFNILHPPADYRTRKGNDRSCVLKIQSDFGTILLPGDIEKVTEAYLLRHQLTQLAADILIAPHHGSRTSSSKPFIQAVDPQIVLFSTGYHNRFGFPKPTVVRRYQTHGARLKNTAESGAIQLRLSAHTDLSPQSYRQIVKRYWHD